MHGGVQGKGGGRRHGQEGVKHEVCLGACEPHPSTHTVKKTYYLRYSVSQRQSGGLGLGPRRGPQVSWSRAFSPPSLPHRGCRRPYLPVYALTVQGGVTQKNIPLRDACPPAYIFGRGIGSAILTLPLVGPFHKTKITVVVAASDRY